jgi:hypothetical protein
MSVCYDFQCVVVQQHRPVALVAVVDKGQTYYILLLSEFSR